MDVLEHLEEEHRNVEEMIAQLESDSTSAEQRRSVLADLGDSLATHMATTSKRKEVRSFRSFDARPLTRSRRSAIRTTSKKMSKKNSAASCNTVDVEIQFDGQPPQRLECGGFQ